MVKRARNLLLLLGALIGLFGQQAAYALGPSIIEPWLAPTASAPVGQDMAMMDCAEMMAQPPSKPAKTDHPCKGLTLACIAQMGCTVPVLPGSAPIAGYVAPMPPAAFEVATLAPLSGRSLVPEPDPPTF